MNPTLRSLGLITVASGVVLTSAAPALAADPARSGPATVASFAAEIREGHKLLASIPSEDGATYEFVQAGDGTIGIAEISPVGLRSRLNDLTGRQRGTALEVFMKVAPGKAPPPELVADHAKLVQLQGRDPMPAILVDPVDPAAAVQESYDPGHCDYDSGYNPGQSQFTWSWYWTLGKFKDFTGQQTYIASHLNGVTGKYWYAGSSAQRWLAACNGNYIFGFDSFQFSAQYQSGGSWHTAYSKQVAPEFKVVYSSSYGATKWRVKLSEISYNVFLNREYGVAVAGNEPVEGLAPH